MKNPKTNALMAGSFTWSVQNKFGAKLNFRRVCIVLLSLTSKFGTWPKQNSQKKPT